MSEASLKPVIAELETLFSKFNARFFENKLESPERLGSVNGLGNGPQAG